VSQDIDTVLLKIASRCNLNCTYCYVYNMGDDSWKSQPKRMPVAVIDSVVDQIGRLSHSQERPLSVVMHGGEPLLLGLEQMSYLVEKLRGSLRSDAGVHVQTNGVLLSDSFIELFAEQDVGVSISFDGPVHDANRLDRGGRGSHDRVVAGISRLRGHPAGERIFGGLLAVVDPLSDPAAVYDALKATGAPSFDFLYRDGNHATLPFGKAGPTSTEYGTWMIALAERYLADPSPPRIRILDDLMRLILGGRGQKEGVGVTDYGIIVIDTDGTVTKNDTLKVAYAGGDRFEEVNNVGEVDLVGFLAEEDVSSYYALQEATSPVCLRCPELGVCGAGMPAHRWSEENGYENPTIFCADQQLLIGYLRRRLTPTPPSEYRAERAPTILHSAHG
jgi:uncharacterized protein